MLAVSVVTNVVNILFPGKSSSRHKTCSVKPLDINNSGCCAWVLLLIYPLWAFSK